MRLHSTVLFTSFVVFAVVPGLAQAACSQQEASAKGVQLGQLVQARMAKDPAAGQAMMMKMQPIMQDFQAKTMAGGVVDWDAVCTQYDAMIDQVK